MARSKSGDPMSQPVAGWVFVTPMIVILGLFLVVPIVMALWVSVSNWTGRGSPFGGNTEFIGLKNYTDLLGKQGLARQDFMTSLRNTFYYVLGVVPIQTALALLLAVLVNQKWLRGRTFFRTAFYFPSVVSSVAISLVFLFLFAGSGAINGVLAWFGVHGPNWFADPRGLIHLLGDLVGVWNIDSPPAGLADTKVMNLSLWEWIKGPSVAMTAIMVPGHLDHGRHLHADVHRRPPGPASRGGGGRHGRRRQRSPAVLECHGPAPATNHPARRHPRRDRHLAGL